MKQPTRTELAYRALERLESGPLSEEAVAQLRQVIDGPTSLLVSKAVDIAASRGLHELVPNMAAAFDRFLADGAALLHAGEVTANLF